MGAVFDKGGTPVCFFQFIVAICMFLPNLCYLFWVNIFIAYRFLLYYGCFQGFPCLEPADV